MSDCAALCPAGAQGPCVTWGAWSGRPGAPDKLRLPQELAWPYHVRLSTSPFHIHPAPCPACAESGVFWHCARCHPGQQLNERVTSCPSRSSRQGAVAIWAWNIHPSPSQRACPQHLLWCASNVSFQSPYFHAQVGSSLSDFSMSNFCNFGFSQAHGTRVAL